MGSRIRVLCADDSGDIVEVFERAARREPDLEPVGGLTDYAELPRALEQHRPHVLLLDLSVVSGDPFAAIREISAGPGAPRVVVFSGYDDPDTRQRAQDAGAAGFASKDLDLCDVFKVIRAATRA